MTIRGKNFLGQGLEVILSKDDIMQKPRTNENNILFEHLRVVEIFPNKKQPRKKFDYQELKNLSESIKKNNVLQPILVRRVNENYELIAGERRWQAAKLAGLNTIPAVIKNMSDSAAYACAVIENIQRANLTPIEEAEAFLRFNNERNMTHEAIGLLVGRSRASISNSIRLLSLIDPVRKLLENKEIEIGHARALLTLPAEEQEFIAKKIVEKNLTVRDAEKLVHKYKNPKHEQKQTNIDTPKINGWINTFTKSLSSKVSIKVNPKGAVRVTLHFSDPSEVDCLEKKLTEKD